MVSSDDEVKLAVVLKRTVEVEKVSRYFGQSVLTVLRRMTGWLECGWFVCWLQTWVKRLDVELVADLGEDMLDDVFSAGEGARCRWCVTRYLVELCCVVGSRWLLELVWYASVEWMWWGCCLPSWFCVVVVVRVSRWMICPCLLVVGRLCVP